MRAPVERIEGDVGAVFEDAPRTDEPVVELARDEMSDHVLRPPATIDVRRAGPPVRDAAEQRTEDVRGPPQEVGRLGQKITHARDSRPARSRSRRVRTLPAEVVLDANDVVELRGRNLDERARLDRLEPVETRDRHMRAFAGAQLTDLDLASFV